MRPKLLGRKLYIEKFSKMKKMITKEKHNGTLRYFWNYTNYAERDRLRALCQSLHNKLNKLNKLKSNIGQRCLYGNNLSVTTYEDVFEVKTSHKSLGYARDIKKNKAKPTVLLQTRALCCAIFVSLSLLLSNHRRKKKKNNITLKIINWTFGTK